MEKNEFKGKKSWLHRLKLINFLKESSQLPDCKAQKIYSAPISHFFLFELLAKKATPQKLPIFLQNPPKMFLYKCSHIYKKSIKASINSLKLTKPCLSKFHLRNKTTI